MEKEYAIGAYCDFFGAYAKIYTMSDEYGNVFYVGCTVQKMENRLSGHIVEARNNKPHTNQKKNEIIKSLNFKIVVKIVDMLWVTADKAINALRRTKALEAEWILKFHSLGYDLCNRTSLQRFAKPIKEFKPEFVGQTFLTSETGLVDSNKILEESVK